MNHPVILVVPVLMLLDFLLTILCAKLSSGVYRKHVRCPHLEVNPLWQKSVDRLEWFNPRYLTLVCVVTTALVVADLMPNFPSSLLELFVGMCLGGPGAACGRHLTNLLTFTFLNRHPTEISGELILTHKLVLEMSLFGFLGLVPMLGLVVVLVPEFYTAGVLLGILVLCLEHLDWVRQAKCQEISSVDPGRAHANDGT
jgi:hypothetical protein